MRPMPTADDASIKCEESGFQSSTGVMDVVVTSIQGLSGSEQDLLQLHAQLNTNAFLTSGAATAGDLMAACMALDHNTHSLGCLHILCVTKS